jgi:carbon storage regulator CsrA
MSLVLTRKAGESILFQRGGKNQRIYVVSVDRETGTVRLAIDAMPDVKVLRRELVNDADLGHCVMGERGGACRCRMEARVGSS